MTNLLAALREGDYSIRARGARADDALGEALLEINALGETLASATPRRVRSDRSPPNDHGRNRCGRFYLRSRTSLEAGEPRGRDLLGQPMDKALGRRARDIGLEVCLDANEDAPLTLTFPGGSGRWGVRRSSFRERGLPHELLVLTDLSRTLREEERNAWQRLVRVIGHEMNNSLAPIKSIAGSLETLIRRDPPPADWRDDARSGLNIIATRAESLSRFMQAYARLRASATAKRTDRSWRARYAGGESGTRELKSGRSASDYSSGRSAVGTSAHQHFAQRGGSFARNRGKRHDRLA